MKLGSGTVGGRVEPDYIVSRGFGKESLESAKKWAVAFGKEVLAFTGINLQPKNQEKEDKRTRNRRSNSKWNIRKFNK